MNWLMIILKAELCYELGNVDPLADFNGNRPCGFIKLSLSHLKSCLYTPAKGWTDSKHDIYFIPLAIILAVNMQ